MRWDVSVASGDYCRILYIYIYWGWVRARGALIVDQKFIKLFKLFKKIKSFK